jgi:tetratricopeptide (TPR) repeat protein/serine/threonine protein kinase
MADPQVELRDLFCEALDRHTPEEQAAYLDQACQGKPEMRCRLDALLRLHDEARTFMKRPATGVLAKAPEANREGPGTHLGAYELVEQIGEGGFGLVFLAEQQHPVRRQVAVKVLKPGLDSRQVIARFEAERQALALMDHPSIAKVLDAGETATGRPYFVMELFRGVPVTDYCDQHGLTSRQRLELFRAVCQAVQHAHQKGLIHRDLKPSNVLVALHDGAAAVKVIDFGIAKALGQHLTDKTLVTGTAQIVGTPSYMSPEQAEWSPDIDTRSDIYSLGVLLYELLTGTTPFEKDRLRQASYDEMRRILLQEDPPTPSTRIHTLGPAAATVSAQRQSDPWRLSQLLRGELDWIVMKALEKDRDRRYETASALAADVQHYLQDEPVAACPPSVWYRCRKFARRNQEVLRTTAAALLVVLLASGAAGWALWDRADQEATHRAEQMQRLADTERAMNVALAKAGQWRDQASAKTGATSQEAEAVLLLWRQAEGALGQAEAALSTGTADDALRQRLLELQLQVAQGRHRDEQRLAQVLRKEKLLHDLDGARLAQATWIDRHFDHAGASARYAAALSAFGFEVKPGQTAELARRIRAEDPAIREALIGALDHWCDCAVATNTAALAKQLREIATAADDHVWRQTLRLALAALDLPSLRAMSAETRRLALPPMMLVLLAESLDRLGEHSDAVALLRWARGRHLTDFWIPYSLGVLLFHDDTSSAMDCEEAMGCWRAALAVRPTATAAHNNLGWALLAKKQVDEAIASFRQAIVLDPKFAMAHYNLGNALRRVNRLDEAIDAYRQALKLDPQQAERWNNLGTALYDRKRLDEAIDAYRRALKLDPRLVEAHSNLGNALQGKNQVDEAIEAYREAITCDPKFAMAHYNLGLALMRKDRVDEAIDAYRQALKLDPQFAPAHANLGNALGVKKQWDEAIAAYHLAIQCDPKYARAHFNLGMALRRTNHLDEAIEACRRAIELEPDFAPAHLELGVALSGKHRQDEAIAAYQRAIAIDPQYALAHYNLGVALGAKNQQDEAIAAYQRAIEIDPKYARAHFNLGSILLNKNRTDEAIAAFRQAVHCDPKLVGAWTNLGIALASQDLLDEAITAYEQAIKVDPRYETGHYLLGKACLKKGQFAKAKTHTMQALDLIGEKNVLRPSFLVLLRQCDRLLPLEKRLPDLLARKVAPADNRERLVLIEACQLQRRHITAARLSAEAFALEPGLSEDLQAGHRYRAAGYAALAAAGMGTDAAQLDEPQRQLLRQQACDWLRADLNLWSKRLEGGQAEDCRAVRKKLLQWQGDPSFSAVRDEKALTKLSALERQTWHDLWADVSQVLKQADDAK